MTPHLELASNWAVALMIFCVLSLTWIVGNCVVISAVYFLQSRRTKERAIKRRFQHVAFDRLSYFLMLSLTVGALTWDLYHYAVSCSCFPLWLRVSITIPALLSGNWAIWQRTRYQFDELFQNEQKR